MRRFSGPALAFCGLVLGGLLIASENTSEIFSIFAAGGFGLCLAALVHVVPMIANAWAWRLLVPGQRRPGLLAMTIAVWLRESVNGLLPVARVGGELVSIRLLRLFGVSMSAAVASLVTDLTIGLATQLFLTLTAVAILSVNHGDRDLVLRLLIAAAIGALLIGLAYRVQRAGAFQRLALAANRVLGGRLGETVRISRRIDRAIFAIYRRPYRVMGSGALQILGWIAGGAEIWVALRFLGSPIDPVSAAIIEILIQALSSAAFVVPAALGIQEGGFLIIGGVSGLTAETALALALARRLRDLLLFGPGLLALFLIEFRRPQQSGQKEQRAEQGIAK